VVRAAAEISRSAPRPAPHYRDALLAASLPAPAEPPPLALYTYGAYPTYVLGVEEFINPLSKDSNFN
jgi:hypothetical protein